MRTLVISGFIKLVPDDFNDDDVFIDDDNLLEFLADHNVKNCKSSVKYYISDKECTLDEANGKWIEKIEGKLDIEINIIYSETNVYLWTDREFNVGGHNILEELSSYNGKFVILVINYGK